MNSAGENPFKRLEGALGRGSAEMKNREALNEFCQQEYGTMCTPGTSSGKVQDQIPSGARASAGAEQAEKSGEKVYCANAYRSVEAAGGIVTDLNAPPLGITCVAAKSKDEFDQMAESINRGRLAFEARPLQVDNLDAAELDLGVALEAMEKALERDLSHSTIIARKPRLSGGLATMQVNKSLYEKLKRSGLVSEERLLSETQKFMGLAEGDAVVARKTVEFVLERISHARLSLPPSRIAQLEESVTRQVNSRPNASALVIRMNIYEAAATQ